MVVVKKNLDVSSDIKPLNERDKRNRTNKVLQTWRDNVALRACSVSARGLWLEMICIMHVGRPYGHLTVNGRPMQVEQLTRVVGAPESQVRVLLDELRAAAVFNRNQGGCIYSREM